MCKVIDADGCYTISPNPDLQNHCITFCPHCRKAVYVMWLKNPPRSLCHNCDDEWGNDHDCFELMDRSLSAKIDNDGSNNLVST